MIRLGVSSHHHNSEGESAMYEYTDINGDTYVYDPRDENYWADCYEENQD
jgi:hypothetical protein